MNSVDQLINKSLDPSERVENGSIPNSHTEQFVATLTKLVGPNGGREREGVYRRTGLTHMSSCLNSGTDMAVDIAVPHLT